MKISPLHIVDKSWTGKATAIGGGRTKVSLYPPKADKGSPKVAALTLAGVKSLPTLLIEEEQSITIGRNPFCQVVVKDALISNEHISFFVKDGSVTLENKGERKVIFKDVRSMLELAAGQRRAIELADGLDIYLPLTGVGRSWAKENAPRYLFLRLMPWVEGADLSLRPDVDPTMSFPYRGCEIELCVVPGELAPLYERLVDVEVLQATALTECSGSYEIAHKFTQRIYRLRFVAMVSDIVAKVSLVVSSLVGVTSFFGAIGGWMLAGIIGINGLFVTYFALLGAIVGLSPLMISPIMGRLTDLTRNKLTCLLRDFKKIFATLPESQQVKMLEEISRIRPDIARFEEVEDLLMQLPPRSDK